MRQYGQIGEVFWTFWTRCKRIEQINAMKRLSIMYRHDSVIALSLLWVVGLVILTLNGGWQAWALVPLGVFAQLGNEYNIHRHIFHLPPPKRQWMFNLMYLAHYGHHDFPTAERLFFVPIWFAVPMAALNFGLAWGVGAVLGFEDALIYAVAIVLVGGLSTFLIYEWFHMTAHLNVPKRALERRVTRLHAQHHFQDFGRWFHVSPGGEVIDKAMGTAISREELKAQSRIEFITTLGLRPDDPRLLAARARYAHLLDASEAEIARAAVVKTG